jgi:hypothetical protein
MSVSEFNKRSFDEKNLAVMAESLYLINLLLLPGIAFLILLWLYSGQRASAPPLARGHLEQTLVASVWAGALLIGGILLIILVGGYQTSTTWVVMIIYLVVCHSTLVLLGVYGLSKAMAAKPFQFPLLGRTVSMLRSPSS